MTVIRQCFYAATLVFAIAASGRIATGQAAPSTTGEAAPQAQSSPSPSTSPAPKSLSPGNLDPSPSLSTPQPLLDFKESDIKFNLQSLMEVLRDRRHEGWVLAAYPDPVTSRPLIGAGFSLDVTATDHPQNDPLNSHPFIEPSSAQLWQAAGFDAERLQRILDQFDRNLNAWGKTLYRRKIRRNTLTPQLTEEEANRLLRISAIQAIENAKAYCRDFNQLTGPQQMALSQLVFQMGVNLEEFVQFLGAMNGDASDSALSQPSGGVRTEAEHWKTVQHTLIDSQWARRYSDRATTVIAMFDPNYARDPIGAERSVELVLRPPVKHHHKKPPTASLRAANDSHPGKIPGKKRSATNTNRS
jgi:hypothetical protein